jgi:HK97 family phage portal protein
MGLISRALEKRGVGDNIDWRKVLAGFGWATATGLTVSPQKALELTAVWACVRVISETVGDLPLVFYRRLPGGGKERAVDHPYYGLLHDSPNPEQTAQDFRETLTAHVATWGNGFAEMELNNDGSVRYFWPLLPNMMEVRRINGQLVYIYSLPATMGGGRKALSAERIFHLHGLGFDGTVGYSPIKMMRQAIALGLATEEYGAAFFGNGSNFSVVLKHPRTLSPEASKRIADSWSSAHEGLSNAHRAAIIEEGMEVEKIGIPPDDAQFLQTRQFQIEEICRIYRMPPHMIQHLLHATYSNIEHQGLEFVGQTIRPWLVRWEQGLKQRMLLEKERKQYFCEHLVDALLRGDIQTRYQAYGVGRQNGWLSANDIRSFENMNPIEGGDVYMTQLNLAPTSGGGTKRDLLSGGPAVPLLTPGGDVVSVDRPAPVAAVDRNLLAEAHRSTFEDVFARIVKREAQDIRQAARKYLKGNGLDEMDAWLETFYAEHKDYVLRTLKPSALTLARLARNSALADIEAFVDEYTANFAASHAALSIGELRQAMRAAIEATQDPALALERCLREWEEGRAVRLAAEQSACLANEV